jgi:rubrerythrin
MNKMDLKPELINLLQLAYSAERAASFAYQGHAKAVHSMEEKDSIKQIEDDEWEHRAEVLKIMMEYQIKISKWYELKYFIIGKMICYSCSLIGWFLPMYFAGRLESGNVNEYFRMKELFNENNITKHDEILTDMGLKEKEHEFYFLNKIKSHKWLPFFEKIFNWGANKSYNNINNNVIN